MLEEMHLALPRHSSHWDQNGRMFSFEEFLRLPLQYPNLNTISLYGGGFNTTELVVFIRMVGRTLRVLATDRFHLKDGTWREALEVLRTLESLKTIELRRPQGREFGYKECDQCMRPDDPGDEEVALLSFKMEEYVLGRRQENPLIGWRSGRGVTV